MTILRDGQRRNLDPSLVGEGLGLEVEVAVEVEVELVVALVLVEELVDVDVCEVPLLIVDAVLGFPNVPPPTALGTVLSPAFLAADLNASRVFGPLRLRVGYTVRNMLALSARHTHGGLMTPTIPAWQCPTWPQ